MAIATIKGKKYNILNRSVLFEFTDSNGKTCEISDKLLHDPVMHNKLKFTTVSSVLKWWVANREALNDTWVDTGFNRERFIDLLEMYFDFRFHILMDLSLEELKSRYEGSLRSPSLGVDSSVPRPLEESVLLEDENTEEVIPEVHLYLEYSFRITLQGGSTATHETKWEKMWNYTYKMDPDDFGWFRSVKHEESVMFGLELEVSTKLSRREIQRIITEVEPKQDPFFIFKSDSSISGGFYNLVEIVTVPCTPRYLRKNWKIFFQKLQKLCKAKNLSVSDVFDTRNDLNNGLHIHVSNSDFQSKPHKRRFLTAWNQWNKSSTRLFNEISGRPYDYTRHTYCKINYEYDGRTLARRLKGIRCGDRQSIAHDQSGSTVEVRVYQGIFDLTHILRCISFTEAVFEFSQQMGYKDFDMNFSNALSKFIKTKRKYAALYSLLQEKLTK